MSGNTIVSPQEAAWISNFFVCLPCLECVMALQPDHTGENKPCVSLSQTTGRPHLTIQLHSAVQRCRQCIMLDCWQLVFIAARSSIVHVSLSESLTTYLLVRRLRRLEQVRHQHTVHVKQSINRWFGGLPVAVGVLSQYTEALACLPLWWCRSSHWCYHPWRYTLRLSALSGRWLELNTWTHTHTHICQGRHEAMRTHTHTHRHTQRTKKGEKPQHIFSNISAAEKGHLLWVYV